MIKIYEIKDGVKTGQMFEMEKEKFPVDLKKCGKTYIKNGITVFMDFKKFNELKPKD